MSVLCVQVVTELSLAPGITSLVGIEDEGCLELVLKLMAGLCDGQNRIMQVSGLLTQWNMDISKPLYSYYVCVICVCDWTKQNHVSQWRTHPVEHGY